MISERTGKLLIAAAIGGIVVWTSFGACSGGDAGPTAEPPPGSVSDGTAEVDASAGEPSAEGGPDEAQDGAPDSVDGDAGDGPSGEGDVVFDVKPPPPGWEPVPWLPLPCWNEVYQPAGPAESVVPALKWVPCAEGGTGCLEIPRPISTDLGLAVYANARKRNGRTEAAVGFTEPWGAKEPVRELALYVDTSPVAAWRLTWPMGGVAMCSFGTVRVSTQDLALALFYGVRGGDPRAFVSVASIESLAAQAKSAPPLTISNHLLSGNYFFERMYASDKLFIGHGVPGLVVAWLPGGPTEKLPGSGYAWDDPRVYDDLVFATRREQVASPEIWVRLGNGQLKPLVQSPGRWAHAFETDGTWMAWLEGVGQGDGSVFDHLELWKVPFATDAGAIKAKKQKVALPDLPKSNPGARATSGPGLYALVAGESTLWVYDLATDARHILDIAPQDTIIEMPYVARDEVWITVGLKPSNANYTVKRFAGSMFVPPL
jgi:hypothetical protein